MTPGRDCREYITDLRLFKLMETNYVVLLAQPVLHRFEIATAPLHNQPCLAMTRK